MASMPQSRRFVTLEHLIIDTFTRIDDDGVERPENQPDQIGGGGTYTIVGARVFLPPSKIGMIVDHTYDSLPRSMVDTLKQYGEEMCVFRERTDGLPTARAVNIYKGEVRGFQYLSNPVLLTPNSLEGTPLAEPLPAAIHFISYPAPRAEKVLKEVESLRTSKGWSPIIVWEPEDEELDVVTALAPNVDIIGPNHHEALRLYALLADPSFTDDDLKSILIRVCRSLVHLRPRVGAVIRAGRLGCCYASPDPRGYRPEVKWCPAYWGKAKEGFEKVVDPTGAGNAFMGGLGAALSEGKGLDEAVQWASVAASFVIEQHGLPAVTSGPDGKELWNGEDPWERLKSM